MTLSLAALCVAPAQAQQRRGFGGFGGGGAMLLMNSGVQKELKATEEQVSKLNELARESFERQRERMQGLRDLPPEERREKVQAEMRAAREEIRKRLAGILNADQVKRFEQIQTQQSGAAALLESQVAEKLKLSDEQKATVREINDQLGASMREIFPDFQSDREGAMKRMAEARKQAIEKAVAAMNDAQKAAWKELTGEPFEVRFEFPGRN
jgi:hypothetical protein